MPTSRRNAPLFFKASELQECARAIAIMAYRFEPEAHNRLISAHETANSSVVYQIVKFLHGSKLTA
jgi:hypothetical protein